MRGTKNKQTNRELVSAAVADMHTGWIQQGFSRGGGGGAGPPIKNFLPDNNFPAKPKGAHCEL
jgi:hypothetical protein